MYADRQQKQNQCRTLDGNQNHIRPAARPSFFGGRPVASAQLMSMLQDIPPAAPNGLKGIVQRARNETGLPDQLKTGVENLSGYSMDDVRVHYNSSKPAQLQALAYTQGSDIHVAPGQERHLPHEAWHVVQQKQGRVQPTMQMKGVNVNDNQGLEREADVMGKSALQCKAESSVYLKTSSSHGIAQRTVMKEGTGEHRGKFYSDLDEQGSRVYFPSIKEAEEKDFSLFIEKIKDMLIAVNFTENGQYASRCFKTKNPIPSNLQNLQNPQMEKQSTIAKNIANLCKKTPPFKEYTEIQCSQNNTNNNLFLSSNKLDINKSLENIISTGGENILNTINSYHFLKKINNNVDDVFLKYMIKNLNYIIDNNNLIDVDKNQQINIINDNVNKKINSFKNELNNYTTIIPLSPPNDKHAEIRIIDEDGWSINNYYLPSGTKEPCVSCYIYIIKNLNQNTPIPSNFNNNHGDFYDSLSANVSLYYLYNEENWTLDEIRTFVREKWPVSKPDTNRRSDESPVRTRRDRSSNRK